MAKHYMLEAAFRYEATSPDDPTMADWLDEVVVHLESLEVDDVMLVSDDTDSVFVVSLLVEGRSGDMPENIVGKGMSDLRTAFHACDGCTPGWPSTREMLVSVNLKLVAETDEVPESPPTKASEDLVPA